MNSSLCSIVDQQIFIEIIATSIEEYNLNKKNKVKITASQKNTIINYFVAGNWTSNRFEKTEENQIKYKTFLSTLKSRTPSSRLYAVIKAHTTTMKMDGFKDFYTEIIKYQKITKSNTCQLIDILTNHILPRLDPNSVTMSYSKDIVKYIESNKKNGDAFLCGGDKNIFSEQIAKYVMEHSTNEQKVNDDEQNEENESKDDQFLDVLEAAIDRHQEEFYEKNKKKIFYVDKQKVLQHFKLTKADCISFSTMKKEDFITKILKKKCSLKVKAAQTLYDTISDMMEHNAKPKKVAQPTLEFNDLFDAIKQFEANKMGKYENIIEYKLRNYRINGFDLLIGSFQLEYKKDKPAILSMTVKHPQKQILLKKHPPKYRLILSMNGKDYQEIESLTSSFKIDMTKIANQETKLEYKYRISLKYGKYHLISKSRTLSIPLKIINAWKRIEMFV